ncbi:IclR family transcriptional regulator [Acetonema longum]|uniref:Glycerol operon regulatory protein n=1 Tax=Acetonema longum DSM 6540 TaxID=1009370 RepID=F7NHW9_9FIRM|nr:IclR family transcriptional regulator [Acetonema longum]EGO64348.1 IclR family transcriptional regulator [Acetonema longum DSM 6540]
MANSTANVHMIQSVQRALSILEEFSIKEKELGVTEIAKRVGLNKSTCFGLLNTLQALGYIEQNSDNGKYRLGLKLFLLGQVYEAGLEIRDIAGPFLQHLADLFQETVHLVVREGMNAVYVDKVEGPQGIRMYSQIGRRVPLHATGVGKAMLAFFSETDFDSVAAKGLPQFTANTITDETKLRSQMALIRQRGYSIDDEEIEIGLRCVAAPIFNHRGEAIAAFSVAGPSMRMTYEKMNELTQLVRETSLKVSTRLGYIVPSIHQ